MSIFAQNIGKLRNFQSNRLNLLNYKANFLIDIWAHALKRFHLSTKLKIGASKNVLISGFNCTDNLSSFCGVNT